MKANKPRLHPLLAALIATTAAGGAAAQTAQTQELKQITSPAGGLALGSSSSVQVYGLIDSSVASVSMQGQRATKLESGHMMGSRLGFKGSEDLGGGLRANFQLEMGINTSNGAQQQNQGFGAKAFGRGSLISLTGNFGELRMGRTLASLPTEVQAVGDPFGLGGGGNLQGIQPSPGRQNNNILYQSPSIGGFIGKAAYTISEYTRQNIDIEHRAHQYTLALFYKNDAWSAAVSATRMTNPTDGSATRYFNSALAYDFKAFKLFGSFATFKNPGAAITPTVNTGLDNSGQLAGFPSVGYYEGQDDRSFSIGASVKLGPGTLLLNAIDLNDTGPLNRDARQYGVAYLYPMSKRTTLYTDYGYVKNKNGAGYTLTGAVTAAGFTNNGNSNAYRVGIIHSF
ncbi:MULTISPECIES: porin [unclassified Comamonas]|uniref:porin n=1 Tax=Comamonas TaxID=283 RepID=UPI0028A2458F|nr:porin [Comamonas sp.]